MTTPGAWQGSWSATKKKEKKKKEQKKTRKFTEPDHASDWHQAEMVRTTGGKYTQPGTGMGVGGGLVVGAIGSR